MSVTLKVSIVCHAGSSHELKHTLCSLMQACARALVDEKLASISIALVDNGPTQSEREKINELAQYCRSLIFGPVKVLVLGDGRNIGFGAGHNLAIDDTGSDFHLVLNPDVELAQDSLSIALDFMDAHRDCGIVVPAVVNRRGEQEYLCKRYPAVLDLLLRGFAPAWLRSMFSQRLARYEMRDVVADAVVWQPPLVSGCFMLWRSSVLAQLKGFSPQYFLYFEDFDLSLRAGAVTRIAYVPAVRVVHFGGYAARKGWRHIVLFVRSAVVFFNNYGWKWC